MLFGKQVCWECGDKFDTSSVYRTHCQKCINLAKNNLTITTTNTYNTATYTWAGLHEVRYKGE